MANPMPLLEPVTYSFQMILLDHKTYNIKSIYDIYKETFIHSNSNSIFKKLAIPKKRHKIYIYTTATRVSFMFDSHSFFL